MNDLLSCHDDRKRDRGREREIFKETAFMPRARCVIRKNTNETHCRRVFTYKKRQMAFQLKQYAIKVRAKRMSMYTDRERERLKKNKRCNYN